MTFNFGWSDCDSLTGQLKVYYVKWHNYQRDKNRNNTTLYLSGKQAKRKETITGTLKGISVI